MIVIPGEDVRRLLPMPDCIDCMSRALAALARGEAAVPLRSLMWLPERTGLLGMMPAHYAPSGVMGIKVVSVMPGNHGTEYDAHQGGVLLFETGHGRPLALVDASAITALRTAAVSAVATRKLARRDAGDLAILGSGVQAEAHLEAMSAVRPIRRVRAWSRTPAHAARFAEAMSARHGITVEAMADARGAVLGADLICTTTSSKEPVLLGEWIAAGAHVNAVGSSVRTARELDAQAVARSRFFVDRRESALNESGDFLLAKAEGAVEDEHIAGELGDALVGTVDGRRNPDEITVFESLGLGVEDVAAAHFVYERALEKGAFTPFELGGVRA